VIESVNRFMIRSFVALVKEGLLSMSVPTNLCLQGFDDVFPSRGRFMP